MDGHGLSGTQEKQNDGILDALSSGANLILTAALDPDLIQLGLSKAKEAGVPVVSSSAGADTPNPVITPPNGGLKYVTGVGTEYFGQQEKPFGLAKAELGARAKAHIRPVATPRPAGPP